MKKTGFTLAEVLITLAIIGVVATMTLPALMNNTQEQQAKTGLKKGINTLTEAAQTNLAIDGFDYGSVQATTADAASNETQQSIGTMLSNRTQIDYKITGFGAAPASNEGKLIDGTNQVIFFRDGSALSVQSTAITPAQAAVQTDGLPAGIPAIYDYNGAKKPNLLSNCQANTAKVKGAKTADVVTDATTGAADSTALAQCTKANRVIKDQFEVMLRGGYAYPRGAAATWAYNN